MLLFTEEEAKAAIARLNDQPFEGRKLIVNVAKAPGSGGPRRTPRW